MLSIRSAAFTQRLDILSDPALPLDSDRPSYHMVLLYMLLYKAYRGLGRLSACAAARSGVGCLQCPPPAPCER
eukprot:jgi/Mesvir1/19689/Mv25176-RA.1